MKIGMTLCFILVLSLSARSQKIAERARIPDAGVSDEYLVTLGTAAAISHLLTTLDDPKYEQYSEGILVRLKLYGDLSNPNIQVYEALRKFIELRSNCEGRVSERTNFTLGTALEVLGQRSGEKGVSYLIAWITSDENINRINCYDETADVATVRDRIRRSAVVGLGLSGKQSALAALLEIKATPPKVRYLGSFIGVVDRAISENKIIQKNGVESFYKLDIEQLRLESVQKKH